MEFELQHQSWRAVLAAAMPDDETLRASGPAAGRGADAEHDRGDDGLAGNLARYILGLQLG